LDEVLYYILKYCSDFYKKYGFKFIDSGVATSFGNAFIILKNENIELRFIIDKDQMFLDFHSNFDKKKNNWYSFDLIRQLIGGENKYFSILDENNGIFIQENTVKIFGVFNKDTFEQTLKELDFLRRKRTKILFG